MLKIPNLQELVKRIYSIHINEYNMDNMPEFECHMFLQTWGSTCTAFDRDENGYPVWGGQMITEEYTTVFHERIQDVYYVCVGEKICYQVKDANKRFLQDLNNHCVLGLTEALENY